MLLGRVVGDEVDDDSQAQFVGPCHECVSVAESAEVRIDGTVVADVVAAIGQRGGVPR